MRQTTTAASACSCRSTTPYGHALDNLSSTFSESANNFNLGYLNPYNPRLDYGNADYDVRHRVAIGGLYEPSWLEFKGQPCSACHRRRFRVRSDRRSPLRHPLHYLRLHQRSQRLPAHRSGSRVCSITAPWERTTAPTPSTTSTLPTAAANPFVNSEGYSDFADTLGGYSERRH